MKKMLLALALVSILPGCYGWCEEKCEKPCKKEKMCETPCKKKRCEPDCEGNKTRKENAKRCMNNEK